MKNLLAAAAIFAAIAPAEAGKRTVVIEDAQSGVGQTKREFWGWICHITDNGIKIVREKNAGAARKRDTVCE